MAYVRKVQIKDKKVPLRRIEYIVCRLSIDSVGVVVNFIFDDGTLISDVIERTEYILNRNIKLHYEQFLECLKFDGRCFSDAEVNFYNYLK